MSNDVGTSVGGRVRACTRFGLLIISIFAGVGCRSKIHPGHYQGIWKDQNQIEVVDIEVSQVSKKKGILGQVTNLRGDVRLSLHLVKKRKNHLKLVVPELNYQSWDLVKKQTEYADPLKNQECYTSDFPNPVELCWDDHDFQLSMKSTDPGQSFTLSAGNFEQNKPTPWEPEREFTLLELVDLVLSQNIDIKIEMERLYRARQTAVFNYLNILPHVRFSTGTAIASLAVMMNPFGMINEIGNLAPFLLPDRWIRMIDSIWAIHAQREGYRAGRANMIAVLEGLVYTLLSQERSDALYRQFLEEGNHILSQVQELEAESRIKKGAADEIQTLLYDVYFHQRETIIPGIRETKAALSTVIGMMNPHVVKEVTVDHLYFPSATAQFLNEKKLVDAVKLRAPELKQMVFLRKYAIADSIEMFFLWLDPASMQNMTFGFNLIPQFSIARSNIREIEFRTEQIEKELTNKSSSMVSKYNSILHGFGELETFMNLEDRRFQEVKNTLTQALLNGHHEALDQYDGSDIRSILDDWLLVHLRHEAHALAFQIARAQLNRLLFTGYQHFLSSENEGDDLLSLFTEDVKVGNPRLE